MAVTKVKAKSKLNKAGIRVLADDLVAHEKRYDQDDLGRHDECGTFACLAGFCYLREIGIRKFNKFADDFGLDEQACIKSGIKQLGLPLSKGWLMLPEIFQNLSEWPGDLIEEYASNGPRWRVIAALKALQRLRPDGTIDPNPKKIHTRLPQLKALLAKTKKPKVAE